MTVLGADDAFNADSIRKNLKTRLLGQQIHFLSTIGSTQKVAIDAAGQGAKEGLLVVADAQSQGRGRQDSQWESPAGVNLYFSLLFRPDWPLERSNEIQFFCAVGAANAFKNFCDLEVNLKWPNDLRIGVKKLGGIILTSHAPDPGKLDYVIMGMGVNLNVKPENFSKEVSHLATSVYAEKRQLTSRPKFLAGLLKEIEDLYEKTKVEGFDPVRQAWMQLAPHMCGPELTLEKAMVQGETGILNQVQGKSKGIDSQGHLLIESAGRTLTILDGTLI